MGDRTGIEWADATWNPLYGCSAVSAGCTHCYATRDVLRFQGRRGGDLVRSSGGRPVWTGRVALAEDRLALPLGWAAPRRIFVASLADPFHEAVPDGYLARILDVVHRCPRHLFVLLTKRPARMRDFMRRWADLSGEDPDAFKGARGPEAVRAAHPSGRGRLFAAQLESMGAPPAGCAYPLFDSMGGPLRWPEVPPNLWLGVSAEDHATAEERVPLLLDTPAAVRVLSAEPLLGPIDLTRLDAEALDPRAAGITLDALTGGRLGASPWHLDWVIAGGESGPAARPMHPDWARKLRDDSVAAGVAFHFKQHGEYRSVSGREGPGERFVFPDGATVRRIGRRAAGRELDGRTWDQAPARV